MQRRRTLSHNPERPPINIEFKDLTYSVYKGTKDSKVILKSINGIFQSGKLTVILGPSGAGKSTLLNILAGYRKTEATGLVTVNNAPRDFEQFHKISRYIMQEDLLQSWLTVEESMMIAADLKLGKGTKKDEKITTIDEILNFLRLTKHKKTFTIQLSGGEKKRLMIALELVNNPPLIFLDEPTTGLDDTASLQCVSLLKRLAESGTTVICSVHSPSAKLFAMFDYIYIIAGGRCAFQGESSEILPFLSNLGLSCPVNYNPADFVIDVASGEYGNYVDKMVTLTENGKLRTVKQEDLSKEITCGNEQIYGITIDHLPVYDCSTWTQFKILLARKLLQTSRDRDSFLLRTGLYTFLTIVVGLLFMKIGQNAAATFSNYAYLFTSLMLVMYCSLLPALLYFPLQIQLIKREYFNRWYNLTAYFWMVTIISIPTQLYLLVIYTSFTYFITDQPFELERFVQFFVILVMVGLISEEIGHAFSAILNTVNALFFGSTVEAVFVLLAYFGTALNNQGISIVHKIGMQMSYLRYGLEGLASAIYGRNRGKIPCPKEEQFCLFTDPKLIMEFHSLGQSNFWYALFMLMFLFVLVKIIAYYLLKQRLAPSKMFSHLKMLVRYGINRILVSK